MGSYAAIPSDDGPTDETDGKEANFGSLLSGRLADIEVDSVEAVRGVREQE